MIDQVVGSDEVEAAAVAVLLEDAAIPFVDIEFPEIGALKTVYLKRIVGRILFQVCQLLLKFLLHRLW